MSQFSSLTHGDIVAEMNKAIVEQQNLTAQFGALADAMSKTKVDYKAAFARARIEARESGVFEGRKVTVDMAEDLATLKTEAELHAFTLAEARYDTCRQALATVRARMEVLRSLMASHREIGA